MRLQGLIIALVLSFVLVGCDLPAGARRAPFPRFDPEGLLQAGADRAQSARTATGRSESDLFADADEDDDDSDASVPLAASGTPTAASGPVLLPISADWVAVMPATEGRAWTWRRDHSDAYVLSHRDADGGDDALILSAEVPSLLSAWPGVEHIVRWHLMRASAATLVGVTRVAWSASLGIGLEGWGDSWVGTRASELLALGMLLAESYASAAAIVVEAETFTGWRWAGRTSAGLQVRLGQMHGRFSSESGARWDTAMVDGVIVALEGWARRAPTSLQLASRIARRLRLSQLQPTLTCPKANLPCTLELPRDASAGDSAEAQIAALYDDRGGLVVQAGAGEIELTQSVTRWRWRGGRTGKYLLRWHSGTAAPPFDPLLGTHAAVVVGEVHNDKATVAMGYIDAGDAVVHGRFVVIACRQPCAAASSITGYLDQLRAASPKERALLRAISRAEPSTDGSGDGDGNGGSFLAQLMVKMAEFRKAIAADSDDGRKRLERWWQTAAPATEPPTQQETP